MISFNKKGCITIDELEGFRHIDDFTKSMPDENPHDRSAGQVMNYTSGTTGKPKGVKRNLVEGDPDDVLSLFAMIFSFYEAVSIAMAKYFIKAIIAFVDTFFIYLVRNWKVPN